MIYRTKKKNTQYASTNISAPNPNAYKSKPFNLKSCASRYVIPPIRYRYNSTVNIIIFVYSFLSFQFKSSPIFELRISGFITDIFSKIETVSVAKMKPAAIGYRSWPILTPK